MADLRLRINELPEELSPAPIDNIAIDGPSTRRTTLQRAADAVRPLSTEAQAREGLDGATTMTPLRVNQAIETLGGQRFATAQQGNRADTAVQPTRTVSAGTGLTGGGTLAQNITLALSSTSLASLAKADSAVQPSRLINPGIGMTGGGPLSSDITLSLNAATLASLANADSAIQAPGGATGQVLTKSSTFPNDVAWQTVVGVTAVSYGPQSLSTEQKRQARLNIGAVGVENGLIEGPLSIRSGSNAAQAFPFGLGWTASAFPHWQFVLETNGSLTLAKYLTATGAWERSPLTVNAAGGINVTGGIAASGNINAGASGLLEGNGNVWGSIWGTNLWNYLNNGGTLLGAAAYPRRSDGAKIVFNWSGQGGQPTWVWGGTDGVNMYVYNPANFSVNWATSAGNANTVGGWTMDSIYNQIESRSYNRTRDYLLGENIPVGGYVFAQCNAGGAGGPGSVVSGGNLYYAHGNGSPMTGAVNVGYGTWWSSGTFSSATGANSPTAATLWKRIG